jgi:RND family efflux transporter MFP subunit
MLTKSLFSMNNLFCKNKLLNKAAHKKKPLRILLFRNMLTFTKKSCTALLVLFLVSACSDNPENNPENFSELNLPYKQSAQLIPIKPVQNYVIDRTYLGQIKTKQDAKLSFEYAGTVKSVLVDMGDVVKKGQTLAIQNTDILTFKKKELQARVNQKQAQIKLNSANLERIQSLTDDGYSSQQRLDELNAENEVLTASVLGLKAQIDAIHYQISKTTLTAPFDGVVTKKMVSTGEHTSPSRAVFQLIKQADNEITLGVPATLASSLYKGSLLTVEINSTEYKGKILSVSQHIDSINRTVQLRLKLTSKVNSFDRQLVKVHINKHVQEAGYWVPLTALTDGVRGQWQVFLALKNEQNEVEQDNAKPVFTIQSATVKVLYTSKDSAYITGLPIKEYLLVGAGLHRFVSGQSIYSLVDKGITQ